MNKKYTMSKFQRIVSLGFQKYGAVIDNDILKIYHINLLPIRIYIKDIKKIFYGITATPVYVLETDDQRQLCIPTSFFEGTIYQELIKDLVSINPDIELQDLVEDFLKKDIKQRKKLKFDFTYKKGEFFKQDFELSQESPSLDAAIGFGIVFSWILIWILFWFGGYLVLESIFGKPVAVYRVVSLVIGSLAFCVTVSNVIIALISMYLGHKVTFISFAIVVISIAISFL